MSLSKDQINKIFDLIRNDSCNFTQAITQEIRMQLIRDFDLTDKEVTIIEAIFGEAFSKVYYNFSTEIYI